MSATGINTLTDVAGAAAAVHSLTAQQKQVAIRNLHATQTLTVRLFTAGSSALAAAAAAATPAVIGASENITVPPGGRTVLMKSSRAVYCSISDIASGASTNFTLEGTIFKD